MKMQVQNSANNDTARACRLGLSAQPVFSQASEASKQAIKLGRHAPPAVPICSGQFDLPTHQ
jgi:hypothetical protein